MVSGSKFLSRVSVSQSFIAHPTYQTQPLDWHLPRRTGHITSFSFYFRQKWIHWQLKIPNINFPTRRGLIQKQKSAVVFQGQRHAVPGDKCVTIPNISLLSPTQPCRTMRNGVGWSIKWKCHIQVLRRTPDIQWVMNLDHIFLMYLPYKQCLSSPPSQS